MELPPELVVHILRGHAGLSTWVSAQRVCKGWRDALRGDAELLTALAEYTGGLTRTHFAGMLGLTLQLASTFPCKPRRSASNGYFLYAPETVAKALHELGGLEAWRPRLAMRAAYWQVVAERRASERWLAKLEVPRPRAGRRTAFKRLRQHELEERIHQGLGVAREPRCVLGRLQV